jgi:sRNA-binding regulator protein Hfq
MQNETPMVLVLTDGETLRGVIEWYDKTCLKLNRTDGANLVIYKESIKYLYKDSDKGVQSETAVNGAAAGQSMTA